ncbi:phytanoyl-CoA dioxygenase family protein [Dongia deserti]|uniref:phytanoyl-CoA dioxygenase family protein n=1 Tax=Dongia deserti TaxID=2268030 RepID=UPI002547B4BA|nr:phytanoyl-CoA dioxygenase family protein [Dongia deserti]
MSCLPHNLIDAFHRDGTIVADDAVTRQQLAALRHAFDTWWEESRNHDSNYGEMIDGRPRFDLQIPGHSRAAPLLRRVNSPTEISDAYLDVVTNSRIPDMVADLIGPNVKFHHSKINAKLPGANTEVKWHQDFPFTPHSNDDLVTALLALDDVDETNGPLISALGSHKSGLAEIWHDGKFTGVASEAASADWAKDAKVFTMRAGSVCLMHTRAGHSSGPNRGTRPRRLFIAVYSAEDAIPLSPNPLPSKHEGLIVRGERTGRVRSVPFELKLPQRPSTGSFFNQQVGYDG